MNSMVNEVTDKLKPLWVSGYDHLAEILFDMLTITMDRGPAAKRVLTIAREKYSSRGEQFAAIVAAAEEEFSPRALSPMEKNLEKFRREVHPTLNIAAGAPIPVMERDRPDWADRKEDQICWNRDTSKITIPRLMSRRSTPVLIPASQYNARLEDDGRIRGADIRLDLRQSCTSREPLMSLERYGWNKNGERVDMDIQHDLTIDEAVLLARALLLFVDLAKGTAETIASEA